MIKCFETAEELVKQLNAQFHETILELASERDAVFIAVSGGNTPEMFFRDLVDAHQITGKNFPWEKIHFFWVDERCVPPSDHQSNFGMVNRVFFSRLDPCEINIHRIKGEADPFHEAERYAAEIARHIIMNDGFPVFDWIFLGVGEDGHTASIFPERMDLLHSSKICEVVRHPATGQFRITLTGRSILQAKRITFMVTGKSKKEIIREIFQNVPDAEKYPAAYIKSNFTDASWYLDQDAAIHLNVSCRGQH